MTAPDVARCWMRVAGEQCCLRLGHVEAHKSKSYRWTAVEGEKYDPCKPYRHRTWRAVFVR